MWRRAPPPADELTGMGQGTLTMREPQAYQPPMEVAEKGRRRAGNWHGAFLLTAATVIVATFLVGTWQPPRWSVIALIGTLGILGTTTVGLLVRTLDELRAKYRMLWTEYADLHSEHSKRASFMIHFTPTRETVESVLRNQAHQVLMYHRQIVELHERGLTSPDAGNPETQLAATKRNFEEKLQGLESQMQRELKLFRELRDNAAWAGETRFNVRESWWDYVPPEYLPKKSKRLRTGEGEHDRHPDDTRSCACPPDDCCHGPLEARPAPDGFVAHEGTIRPHPFRRSTSDEPVEDTNERQEQP